MKMTRFQNRLPRPQLKRTSLLLLFAGSALLAQNASAASYTWINNGSSGNYFTSNSTNYAAPRPAAGGPTAADDLVITGTSNIALQNSTNEGDRAVNNLTVTAAASNIHPGSSVPGVTFTIHGNLNIAEAASISFSNSTGGAGPNQLLDVEVKGNISIASGGALYIGNLGSATPASGYYTRSFQVTGTGAGLGQTNVNGNLVLHRNTKTVSLGDLSIGVAGKTTLSGAADATPYDGDFTKEINARSLSGTGILEGSTVTGTEVTANSTFAITTVTGTTGNFAGTLRDGSGTNAKLHLKVAGSGTQILSGSNSYTGATTIDGATLVLSGSGSIANTSGIAIDGGGTLIQNSSTALTAPITFTNGTISGSGEIATHLTIGANRTLSPGNSPGSQTFNAGQTWDAGGNYNWQIHDASGVAGVGFDTISITGTLDLLSLSSENRFNLNLWSLSEIGPDVNGAALNFDAEQSSSWLIASAGLISYNGDINDLFQLNLGAFNGTGGFQNTFNGIWSLSVGGGNQQLILNYTAVPEPGSMVLLSGGFAAFGLLLRRSLAEKRN